MKKLTEAKLTKIIEQYDIPEYKQSTAYGDGGPGSPWPRFERAAGNQMTDGEATLARYAIWANTVRDNIVQASRLIEAGKKDDAQRLLVCAANSLSAFSDVQAYFDPFNLGKRD